ncbi:hypothetical protein [Marinomonas transparens]|uniref:Uncharacterized protein n=1 Tax=Marinomonas transparens TaxID=2795388 RepID=A0A934MYL0_9GAMM|nr:hypothetical protein [Marinomonas transparens]MBJ7536575.1 hypothetical protein [Marinomonas transparens]
MTMHSFVKKHSGFGVMTGCVLFLLALIPNWNFLYSVSALCYWMVFLTSWSRLSSRNKRQIFWLMIVALSALCVTFFTDMSLISFSLLEGNIGIVAMLTGVSLLGLLPDSAKKLEPAKGNRGIIHTWSSVHLLGSVINMSAIFLVGDKLQRQSGTMTMPQYSVLVRGLTSAGLWSPFFASLAVALSIAPDAKFYHLALLGIPMALCSCCITLWEFKRNDNSQTFIGFPIAISSLIFPVTLAFFVIIFHYFILLETPILSVVTLLSPIFVVVLLSFKRGLQNTTRQLKNHVQVRLSNMANEIALFLSAGFLSKTVSLALMSVFGENWSIFSDFSFIEAILCFLGICLISLLGLHPIIGISLMSSLVPATSVDNTLLAFVSLSSWALGTAISPLSGINLSISGKYGIDNFLLARSNWLYGTLMTGVVIVAMALLVYFLENY